MNTKHPHLAPWTLEDLDSRVAALAPALEGFESIELLSDGSRAVGLAPEHFGALVAAGGVVDTFEFPEGDWSDVRLTRDIDGVTVLLHAVKVSQ